MAAPVSADQSPLALARLLPHRSKRAAAASRRTVPERAFILREPDRWRTYAISIRVPALPLSSLFR